MLVSIAVLLLILWMLGWVVFKTAGAFIHVLLVIALILVVLRWV